MDVLWETSNPLTVRAVSERLTERDLAHTTVMTVLDRLAKKGFALRERDGRAWQYRASASREAYVTELMLSALDQAGDRQAALASFAGPCPIPRPGRCASRSRSSKAGPGTEFGCF